MEYFDNTKPNVIILSDKTDVISMQKTLGPYKVASALRDCGFEVAIIHHLSVFTLEEIKHILKHTISEHTLFVGVNNMFYASVYDSFLQEKDGGIELKNIEKGSFLPHGKHHNREIKDFVKSLNSRIKLVLGGPTALDEHANKDFDYIVSGYADISIVNLANHLMGKESLNKSHKSVFGPIIVNDSKAESYDFSMSKLIYKDYDAILNNEILHLEIGRGCIFKCKFCSFPLNGKKKLDFIRDYEILYQELLENYNRFKITKYIFCDDTFNDSPEKCKMMYDISKKLPFKLEWWGYIRLDLLKAHPETIKWVFESGCKVAFFGIETLNLKPAKIIGKGGSRAELYTVIDYIKEQYGNSVSLHGSFIFGLPGETLKEMIDTSEFLLSDKNSLDSWAVRPLRIRELKNGAVASEFLSEFDANFEKYGYSELNDADIEKEISSMKNSGIYSNERPIVDNIIWKNEYTNFLEVWKLADETNRRLTNIKISDNSAFWISGLGLKLESLLNKNTNDIDWHGLDKIKFKRAQEYKNMIFDRLKVPSPQHNYDPDITTFSSWLYTYNRE